MDINRIQKISGIVGTSNATREVLEMISQVAPVNISVLINGESGTGKEMVAKAIHQFSKRSHEELVTVNCGAIPEGIIESELFGHKKGSYTGAGEDRKGYFETAHKGTIFLDEIGETPLETQVKLLRVLESGEFMRVGDSKSLYTDVRVIAATNNNLGELASKGQFRQDLYYRLKTVTVDVPPLRNRVEDISALVERFALLFTQNNDMVYRGFMPDSLRLMKQFDWPGNVRELKNFVESIIVMEKGERITLDMVQKKLGNKFIQFQSNPNLPVVVNTSSEQAERELMLRQLFLLRQDVDIVKSVVTGSTATVPYDMNALSGSQRDHISIDSGSVSIDEGDHQFIRDDAIGELTMEDLEREAITRTLQFFNNNRRAAARSLGMSERTLYRKIGDFGLERKIKRDDNH
ncbi:MAG: sigma-54-dependent Fis family transcriptional regulator [Candidatus Marinimicrobia bacterium]|nr:sigma-54-dependent Fis family transcriptional regulator [Candidatus Neomarinimicrobiota bacterium]